MAKIILTVGLPASGKSTWAKEQVARSQGNIKRVNRDDLRAMIDPNWTKHKERFIIVVRNSIIADALSFGHDVIVDDTNLQPAARANIEENFPCNTIEYKVFDVPFDECMRRNALREGTARVPDEAMFRMKRDWERYHDSLSNK